MKTKSQVKSSKIKSAPASQSKLASIRGAVTSAIFGTGKKQSPVKSASPSKTSAKSAKPAASAKSAAPAKAAPAKKVAATKSVAAKPAASTKAAAPKAPAAPVKAATASKATAAKTPAAPAGKAGKTPAPAAPAKTDKASKLKGAIPGTSLRTSPRSFSRHSSEEVCREVACEGLSTSGGYCRLHYIKNWKKIKRKELILKEGKLNQYIEELVAKYPDKYIEAIRQDLAEDKAFAKVIYDLDLDESSDEFNEDGENVDNLIDTIKRDFDDEGDAF